MSESKKYYWLKLKSDFFDDDTIKFIEEQENGIKYSNFYLKLCLKSLKTDGKLIRLVGETLIPYDINSLSKLTGVDFDTVRSAMQLFESIELIKVLESGEIYLSQIDELIGSETDKAQMMRRLRAERKITGNNVTQMLPEKEIDIEKEKEKEKEKETYEKDVKNICNSYEEHMGNENENINKNININKNNRKRGSKGKKEEEKIHFAEFVSMTNADYEKLVSTYGKEFADQCIKKLDNYKGSSGKTYKSDYRAILSWVVDKVKENGQRQFKNQPSSMGNPFFDLLREEGKM